MMLVTVGRPRVVSDWVVSSGRNKREYISIGLLNDMDMVDMMLIWLLYIICHPEHVHTLYLHEIYYIIWVCGTPLQSVSHF